MILEGAVVRLDAGTKRRTGVVIRLFERDGNALAFVPWGTGTSAEGLRQVTVAANSREAHVLGLYKTTYFREGNVTICPPSRLEGAGVYCPPNLVFELKNLFGL